jgi:hypothetical protein
VLALIAWSLATTFLPFGWPGYSDGTYWLAALAAAGVFQRGAARRVARAPWAAAGR